MKGFGQQAKRDRTTKADPKPPPPPFVDVVFVNQSASADLAYVNDAGNVIIKVDNTSVVPYNEKRNTVKITTEDTVSCFSPRSRACALLLRAPTGAMLIRFLTFSSTELVVFGFSMPPTFPMA